jgi:intergrase/recombinase
MITLYFIKKTVYGNDLYYPDCEATKNLAKLAKRKSFDLQSVKLLALHIVLTAS